MKKLAVIIAALALTGCAHHNHWVGPAVAGAVVGVAVHEAMKPPHAHHPQPQVIYAPPPVIVHRHCQQVPIYNHYGYVIGYRTMCY